MTQDPIVREIREAGAELAKEAGNSTHEFFVRLRKAQKKYARRLTRTKFSQGGSLTN